MAESGRAHAVMATSNIAVQVLKIFLIDANPPFSFILSSGCIITASACVQSFNKQLLGQLGLVKRAKAWRGSKSIGSKGKNRSQGRYQRRYELCLGFHQLTPPLLIVKKIKIGQYLKIQLAYATGTSVENLEPGYFSTVATVKYTSKPEVYIEGLETSLNKMRAFRSTYLGVYQLTGDKSERPYSYNFSLYDRDGLVETSGWLLHNTNINTSNAELLTLDKTTDSYTFKSAIPVDVDHYVQYGVRTINNLEIYSPMYTVIEPGISGSTFLVDLNAENIYEEGYIELSLTLNNGAEGETSVSIEILRAELTDNFSTWRSLKREYFSSYEDAAKWRFRDMTIE